MADSTFINEAARPSANPGIADEGQAITVLAEVVERTERYTRTLETKLAAADGVRASITETMDRLHSARAKLREAKADVSRFLEQRDIALGRAAEANEVIARAERRLKELNAMIDYGVEDEQVFQEVGRAGKAQSEKTAERDKHRAKADEAEARARDAEQMIADLTVEIETRASEIKTLQKELPDPHLFAWLGLAQCGRANARYLLEADATAFARTVRAGVSSVKQMHQEMREGRYRLDRYGDLLAGRHEATVQTMYAAVAIGDTALAAELFSLAADPSMFFHQIFNVFRVWALGSLLLGDTGVVLRMLRTHRFEKKLWGGYVKCFRAIAEPKLAPLAARHEFNVGLQQILRFEVRPDGLERLPGVQLVHLPALALCRLARQRRIEILLKDKRLPAALMRW